MFNQNLALRRFGLIISTFLAAVFMLAPGLVSAQNTHDLCTGANLTFKDQGCDVDADGKALDAADRAESKVGVLVKDIINLISVIVGIAAVVMIVYAGFRFVTSGGNPETTKSAKNTILYAIVGLVIVAFAQFIVKFVLDKISN